MRIFWFSLLFVTFFSCGCCCCCCYFMYFAGFFFFICTATWSKRKTFSFLRFSLCATERKKNEQHKFSFNFPETCFDLPFRSVFNRFVCYVFIFPISFPCHFVSFRFCVHLVFQQENCIHCLRKCFNAQVALNEPRQ